MQIADPRGPLTGHAVLRGDDSLSGRCSLAKKLIEAGEYEPARDALRDFWPDADERPPVSALEPGDTAELLLWGGVLKGWRGASGPRTRALQEQAKDLITESARAFAALGEEAKVAECGVELSLCYWREGAFNEARATLEDALEKMGGGEAELRARALLRLAEVERAAGRHDHALARLREVEPLIAASPNNLLRGSYHNTLALVVRGLGGEGHVDRALIEYTAAGFYFEQAGNARYRARVENNIGFLLFTLGRFAEAHEHLDRARDLFSSLGDLGGAAQVDETCARSLVAQGRYSEAEEIAAAAARTLSAGDELSLLSEACATHGVALARLGLAARAGAAFAESIEVAERAGDLRGAGLAHLAAVEELHMTLGRAELREHYERADELLGDSTHTETLSRLRRAARRLISEDARPAPAAFYGKRSPSIFVGESPAVVELLGYAKLVARAEGPVLITGETGTGKELIARLLHEWSGRGGNFVALNCAALCETMIESQLFGHRKGSYTGAVGESPGAARLAEGGTLFLDEIGALSPACQGKLLRLIEGGEIHPVGSPVPEHVNVRVVAATNGNSSAAVARGTLRPDIFYRLGTFLLSVPPLRERRDDVEPLARHFVAQATVRHAKQVSFTPEAFVAMRELPLEGNARELSTLVERAFLLLPDGAQVGASEVETLALRQTRKAGLEDAWAGCSLEEEVRLYEGKLIRRALEAAGGRVTHAARLLGMTHQALSFVLGGRQKHLLGSRVPAKRRRTSVMRPPAGETQTARKQTSP